LAAEVLSSHIIHLSENKNSKEGSENIVRIFYKQDSIEINKSSINYKGNDIFMYIHGGYWQAGRYYLLIIDSKLSILNFELKKAFMAQVKWL
jgi:hypothetical protein